MMYKTIVSIEDPNSESRGLSPNSVNSVLRAVSCVFQRVEQFVPMDSGKHCFYKRLLTGLLLNKSTYY